MMDDDQISFRSASPMFDEVEDYSHQIAQMIGIKNDNFIEAGVSQHTLIFYYPSQLRFLYGIFILGFVSGENYIGYWMWLW